MVQGRLTRPSQRRSGLPDATPARPRRLKSRASVQLDRRPACAGEDWVSRLPDLIDAACEEWHLSLDDERLAAGAWGVVAWCHTESGLEAALKLCENEQRLSAETNAMLAWGGRPAVRVLAHRPGALLLERARPGRPSRLAPARLALLLDALHRPTSAAGEDSETGVRASSRRRKYLPCKPSASTAQTREGRPAVPCTAISSRRTSLSTAAPSW